MSELSWLVDLLVNFKLPKPVKDHVVARIKEIDSRTPQTPMGAPRTVSPPLPPALQGQSASTIANLMKEPGTSIPSGVSPAGEVPTLQGSLVASPQAAQAIQNRQALLGEALSGKPEPGRTSPRKFRGNL